MAGAPESRGDAPAYSVQAIAWNQPHEAGRKCVLVTFGLPTDAPAHGTSPPKPVTLARLRNDERQIDRMGLRNSGPSKHQTGYRVGYRQACRASLLHQGGGSNLALPRDSQSGEHMRFGFIPIDIEQR
jgi:hypothetical protein